MLQHELLPDVLLARAHLQSWRVHDVTTWMSPIVCVWLPADTSGFFGSQSAEKTMPCTPCSALCSRSGEGERVVTWPPRTPRRGGLRDHWRRHRCRRPDRAWGRICSRAWWAPRACRQRPGGSRGLPASDPGAACGEATLCSTWKRWGFGSTIAMRICRSWSSESWKRPVNI